jgi:hypothetical protein
VHTPLRAANKAEARRGSFQADLRCTSTLSQRCTVDPTVNPDGRDEASLPGHTDDSTGPVIWHVVLTGSRPGPHWAAGSVDSAHRG